MPKQAPIIIAVVAVILVAAGAYLALGKKSQTPETPSTTTATEQKSEDSGSIKGSIKSLLSRGKNVSCTVKYPMRESSYEGKVYVSANKMRGNFSTTVEGKQMENHMISDGMFMYSWTSGTPQGVKFKIEETQAQASPVAGQSEQVDIDKEVDMDCSSWSVDNSMFTPPSDVKFSDFSQMMKPASSPAPGGQTQQNQGSSVCDSITDPEAKAACKSAGY